MRRWTVALALTAMLAATTAGMLSAQAPSLGEQQARLNAANRASKTAQAKSAVLERAAAAERDEARAARTQEAAIAARAQAAEADIAAAQARIAIIDRLLGTERVRLSERQGPILKLVAAIQSMSRRPPLLALVQPGTTDDLVHVRAVLGTVIPVVRTRTADIRAEIARVHRLRQGAAQATASLRDGRARLERERLALVQSEAAHRLRSRELGRSALIESDRAIALGEQARDLVDLMQTMDRAAETGASLASLPGPLPRPVNGDRVPIGDAPASRAPGPPPYRLPVQGRLIAGMGEVASAGVRARGLTLAPRPNAQIVAPAAGRILYAAPFRGYGAILIIDHGGGWTSLITGFDRLSVRVGDSVVQGSPIGRAQAQDMPQVTVELRRRGRPLDLTPLLG